MKIHIRPLRDLPNQEGFKFIGLTNNNDLGMCEVIKNDKGMHVISGEYTYLELKGWFSIENEVKVNTGYMGNINNAGCDPDVI